MLHTTYMIQILIHFHHPVITRELHYPHTSYLYSHHSPSSCTPSPSPPSPSPWRCPCCLCPTPHTLAITLSPSSAGCWACSAPSWSRAEQPACNKTVFNLTQIYPDLHRHQANQDDHHLGHLQVEGLELLRTSLRFFFIPDNLSLNNRLKQSLYSFYYLWDYPAGLYWLIVRINFGKKICQIFLGKPEWSEWKNEWL